ncbi:MAG TPA: class I SAM-dependent methyltransferase, partial [Pseudomonas sp.]|nr:class I SAM-dependent methyltransferase [Pseudomonas sp.]
PELLTEGGCVLACINAPDIDAGFLIDGMATEAPTLRFEQRLANPPEFADIDPEGGLKAMVFRAV